MLMILVEVVLLIWLFIGFTAITVPEWLHLNRCNYIEESVYWAISSIPVGGGCGCVNGGMFLTNQEAIFH